MSKQSTSTDVARLAGVSQTTVSFVLNNRHDKSISKETCDRVIEAARELRYRSNRLSEGILRGKSGLVGVVMPTYYDYYYGNLLSGICEEIEKNNANILLMQAGDAPQSESESINRLMEYRVDGIVCVANDWGSKVREVWLDEVLTKGIPLVIVDDRSHASRADCIVTDDVVGACTAVAHFAAQGHRRIAHIAGYIALSTAQDRKTGYLEALSLAGIHIDSNLIIDGDYSIESAERAAETVLSMNALPTAVFAASDILAMPLLKKMAQRGLRCPQDITVIGYSDTNLAPLMDLSSVAQNSREIGVTAARVLLKRAIDLSAPPSVHTLPTQLTIRQSSEWRMYNP